jgi:hypothetical protein
VWAILLISLMLAGAVAAQPAPPSDSAVDGTADEISRAVAAETWTARRARWPTPCGKAQRRSGSGCKASPPLGKSQYVDRVYARAFGKTSKDMIDKIMFEQNILYVRYLFSVDQGSWRLIRFDMNTELTAPFPKGWAHIYA